MVIITRKINTTHTSTYHVDGRVGQRLNHEALRVAGEARAEACWFVGGGRQGSDDVSDGSNHDDDDDEKDDNGGSGGGDNDVDGGGG